MPRALAVVSQKGGVGKTTTAINLAAALAMQGIKTLLVDTDPQGSVRFGLGLLDTGDRVGVSDFIEGACELHEVVRPTAMPWLRAVTAGTVSERGTHEEYQREFARSPRVTELLNRARERGYVVIVDTPPGLGPIAHRVLVSADGVLVPLQSEPLALQTTSQLLRGIRAAAGENPALSMEGIVLTMTDPQNPTAEAVATHVREQLPAGLVLEPSIPRSVAVMEAFAAGQPMVVRAPDDPASRAYAALAGALAEHVR